MGASDVRYHREAFRWGFDVEELWSAPVESVNPFKSTEVWRNSPSVQAALSLLPNSEQEKVLKFVRYTDAKLALGSCLMKRAAICKSCQLPWPQVKIGEDQYRKPCHLPSEPKAPILSFNVSHHGSLVCLVGCSDETVQVGIDIVQMNLGKDLAAVLERGFANWVKIYEAVFSEQEIRDILSFQPSIQSNLEDELTQKLRCFYSHWCLKEAYIKMTGKALLDPDLKSSEARNVSVPVCSSLHSSGQPCTSAEIWCKDTHLSNVQCELVAWEEHYLIATCVSSPVVNLLPFISVSLEKDIFNLARNQTECV